MEYFPGGKKRPTIHGVDTPTNFAPHSLIECHNEMTYNPIPAGRIAFYAMQEAARGGQTLLKRNIDMTKVVSNETKTFIKQHGGIRSLKSYHDNATVPAPKSTSGSWQEIHGVETYQQVQEIFLKLGFPPEGMKYNPQTTIFSAIYKQPGFYRDAQGQEIWFSNADMGNAMCADGTGIPVSLRDYERKKWHVTTSFKLRKGDWLVLDNMAVQHGRMPYQDSPEKTRILLDVYTR